MKRLCLVLLVIVLGSFACASQPDSEETASEWGLISKWAGYSVYFFHDAEREVGIWVFAGGYKGGISVLPDADYR